MTLRCIAPVLLCFLSFAFKANAQYDTCISTAYKHKISSVHLGEARDYWVSLPLRYDSTASYPVIYLFDAEWRFEMVRHVAFDLGGNKKTPGHIIVGIPHVDWEYKRGQDLTFSQSRTEYDGEAVDSTWYNEGNSGNGAAFYAYLTKELIPDVERHYACNDERILVGHSYGGYFGAYLLSKQNQPFTAMQLYDPSVWYSDGEVISRFREKGPTNNLPEVFITYQPEPAFHAGKIEEFIEILEAVEGLSVEHVRYPEDSHNSLYLPSFLAGMKALYRY